MSDSEIQGGDLGFSGEYVQLSGQSNPKTQRVLLVRIVVLCIIGIFYISVALLSQKRKFDSDEFLHLHSAWSTYKGLVPYRDYFDHYTPLFHLFFVPLFHFFRVETDIRDSLAFLFFARKLEWLISGLVLVLTFWLGKLWKSTEVGLAAVLFLVTTEAYWNMALEVRPDTLATGFWLLSLIAVVRAVQGPDNAYLRRKKFIWSGLFLALAFLTIQKIVYAFPGVALGMCWYIWKPSNHGTRGSRIGDVTFQFAGFCIPMIITAAYFYYQNGLAQFIRFNFLFFLGAAGDSPYHPLFEFLYMHPFMGLFCAVGLLCSLATIFRKSLPGQGDFIIAPATLSLIVGLFLIPFPYYQYYISFLPLVAVSAAAFLFESAAGLANFRDRRSVGQWISLAALISIAVLCGLVFISWGAGSQWPLVLIVGYWFGTFVGCLALVFRRAPAFAMILFFVAIVVGPLIRLRNSFVSPGVNKEFEEMRYIMENTTPMETVMDGYQGSGLYRPHAYFYWFLTFNDRSRIPENERQELVEGLHNGSIAPKLILFDINLRNLSPGVTEYLENNYEPVGTGVIWKRKISAAK